MEAVDRIDRIDEDWRVFNRDKETHERQVERNKSKKVKIKQNSLFYFSVFSFFFFVFRTVTGGVE